jgi:hypothetical protein
MTAEIRRSGTDILILAYHYAEGTEHMADPHTDIINFPVESSGKTAYFVIRLHDGKSGYGPYYPIFHAIVP